MASAGKLNSLVLLLVLAGLAGAAYYRRDEWIQQPAEARYLTEAVSIGDVTQTVSANGTLNPVVLVNVGTQVSGTVKKIYADFNDRVEAGQVLMELDPALFEAQAKQSEANVANAQATLELAKANEARIRALHEQDYVSKQELDTAVQALKSARAQLALARAQLQKDRTNLGYTVIRSPVSGVVVAREVDAGQTVAASFQTPTLFRIAQDLSQMQIDSNFAEADIGSIRVGQPVNFSVDAFPNRSFTGTVKQVRLNPTSQQNVVTYDVVVAVNNPDLVLLPGMTAYVKIAVAERKGVLLVPNAALRFKPQDAAARKTTPKPPEDKRDGARATVYQAAQDRLSAVTLTPGITDSRYTEVVAGGIKAGEQVVVEDRQATAGANQPSSTFRIRVF